MNFFQAVHFDVEQAGAFERVPLMLAHEMAGAGVCKSGWQKRRVLRQVIDGVQQRLVALLQVGKNLGALIEKIIQQFRRHDRVVGYEIAPPGQCDVGQRKFGEIVVQVFPAAFAAIDFFVQRRRVAQIECGADGRRTIGKIVVCDCFFGQPLEQQQ